ncbi:PVC-type heme-binding CxxCH protein [Thalassoroseus pseudoceratinae]|uniref:PVC-type heme-binding CxxCH protein n=1 Tax=Thalassoroseus pseudoceratinae TaxID=2713176 RepID=UPI001421E887|nr:PVC-type heme-binding CxxCH protein [Thalassoroseus pseudoceratinae]
MVRWTFVLAGILTCVCADRLSAQSAMVKSPVPPKESIQHLEVHPNVHVELVACEPQIVDPVAIAFDASSGLYVVQMTDYPNGPADGEAPKSKIKYLQDKDDDGFFETAHVFADELLFANGVLPWRGGVIVTMAGEVAYFKDTDGDHKADVRETWFTGFAEQNPQLRANHPTLGIDGYVYIANGLRGGDVIARKKEWAKDAKPISLSGRDFRFDPLTGEYEAVTGIGQFGLTFDDYGRRFVCSNRNPCKHLVFEDHYLKKNPQLAISQTAHDVSPAAENSRVYPKVNAWTTSTLHSGQFTAACGVTVYRGSALPQFYGNSFTCEPTGSLVHRDVWSPMGATFNSTPGRKEVEFLASKDSWFRPVNLAHGPDGALYVCDMYRAVIEHPQFMPTELKTRRDLTNGDTRGRIYRLTKKPITTDEEDKPVTNLADFPSSKLVPLLDANTSQRETAVRLLVERQDKSIIPAVAKQLKTARKPAGRVAALSVLRSLGGLESNRNLVLSTIKSDKDRVAEIAVRFTEEWLSESDAELLGVIRDRAKTADPRLQFQIALSLSYAADDASDTLAEIALNNLRDDWIGSAVLIATKKPTELLTRITNSPRVGDADEFLSQLGNYIGRRNQPAETKQAFATISELSDDKLLVTQLQFLNGLASGLRSRGQRLPNVVKTLDEPLQERINAIASQALELAANSGATASVRQVAMDFLAQGLADADETLFKLATSREPQSIRMAAITVLGQRSSSRVAQLLKSGFAEQTPTLRSKILDAAITVPTATEVLLSQMEAQKIKPAELSVFQSRRLTSHRNPEIRKAFAKIVQAATPADRKQVLSDYQTALSLKADAAAGREVFAKNCATCHRIGKIGVNVAPDIADSRTKTPQYLLTNILDPNRAVDNNYFSFTVLTVEGQIYTGLVATETATSVTLKQPEGKTITLLRSDIEQMKSDGVSLMPVGLEKNITPQQMANLISFIKNWRYLDGDIPIDLPGE